jgi:hypothetical protein
LFGGIGTLLVFVGVLVELYLTIDKLLFGQPIGQRPLLLFGVLLIIVGVQLLSLGLIGELIASSRARGGPDAAQIAAVIGAGWLEAGGDGPGPQACAPLAAGAAAESAEAPGRIPPAALGAIDRS